MTSPIIGTYGMSMHVHDLAKARKFYAGLGLKELYANQEGAGFQVPDSGPITLHRWQSACQTNGGRPPGTVSGLMLLVTNAQEAADAVKKHGGTVTAPPFPAPTGKGSWGIVADPDGNEFLVCDLG